MNTGSGIFLSGFVDTAAAWVICVRCARNADNEWLQYMEPLYSPDVNDDTPKCEACEESLPR